MLRRWVLVLDNNQCQLCGSQIKLEIHHVDHDPQNNDVSNLRTLCTRCHDRFTLHRFGKGYRFFKVQGEVIKYKGKHALILPKPWLDCHGDKAENLTLLGDAILIVVPEGYEEKARKLLEKAED